jgi:tripeptide aminopeptidase
MSTVLNRFLRYVQVDTQSDPNSVTFPSTQKQHQLSEILVAELLAIGVSDVAKDSYGYVYATIPSNSSKTDIPVICFCSHIDTSPDVTGEFVKPLVHKNWDGAAIVLPDDPSQILRIGELNDLDQQIGNDIVTASGTTLLGADNKAGVAEIMTAAAYLVAHPEIKHGTIKILFTPDEEVGRGTEMVDLDRLGAQYGYTVDGEAVGTMEDETFSADGLRVVFTGISTHPGYAKGKLQNALKMAAQLISILPKDSLSPETTEGMEGFIHPVSISGIQESATVDFIIRDFNSAGLREKENSIRKLVEQVLVDFPGGAAEIVVTEQYRNMKEILANCPEVVEYAMKAMKMAGLEPIKRSIRGGTDGSRLSFMGLPCPNIFAGEHAFHSKLEWVSVQDMEKAVEVIVNICKVWEEQA